MLYKTFDQDLKTLCKFISQAIFEFFTSNSLDIIMNNRNSDFMYDDQILLEMTNHYHHLLWMT